jgi:hypothetical protein
MVAVYAIVKGNEVGWTSARTLGLLALAAALLGVFVRIESRASAPLVPLGLFRLRNLATANVMGVLWAAAMFAWFFLTALYLQLVLGYSPLEVGLAFLPGNLIMGALSLGVSARLVLRYGIRTPLVAGLSTAAVGLLLFARAPVDGSFVVTSCRDDPARGWRQRRFSPSSRAMSDVEPGRRTRRASSASVMMGGALGLAVLANIAASRTDSLEASGERARGWTAAIGSFLAGAIAGLAAAVGGARASAARRRPMNGEAARGTPVSMRTDRGVSAHRSVDETTSAPPPRSCRVGPERVVAARDGDRAAGASGRMPNRSCAPWTARSGPDGVELGPARGGLAALSRRGGAGRRGTGRLPHRGRGAARHGRRTSDHPRRAALPGRSGRSPRPRLRGAASAGSRPAAR